MEKKNISLDFNLRFQEIKSLNPSFDIAKVSVAYYGLNRNRSIISKEVFDNAKESMFNIPIVGRYIPEDDNFGGHDITITEKDGKKTIETATVPFGVVPESADIHWETLKDDDGTEREYLTTSCVIWKRSFGYDKLVAQTEWGQSMEITVNDYEIDKDDNMVIKDMTFNALCILGNGVEPCFEGADVKFDKLPDNESFRNNFALMIGELKELAAKSSATEINIDYKKEEDGDKVENDLTKTGAATESTETVDTAFESKHTAALDFETTYKQKCEKLSLAVEGLNYKAANDTEYHFFYLNDFDSATVYMTEYVYKDDKEDHRCCGAKYAETEQGYSLSTPETMVVMWLTEAEYKNITDARDELASLRSFKAERLAGDHAAETDSFVNEQFGDIVGTEEFNLLKNTMYTLDREELSEKLYAIRGKHASYVPNDTHKDIGTQTESTKIPIENKTQKSVSNRYGNLFSAYGA